MVNNYKLTAIEIEILQLAADGFLNKQKAGYRGTSLQTIKNQVVIILRKLQATGITHAVAIGLRDGIIK